MFDHRNIIQTMKGEAADWIERIHTTTVFLDIIHSPVSILNILKT
jgi:hypothetical protein